MLILNVTGTEYYDEINEEFISIDSDILKLEHSLYSLTEWESVYKKSFLETINSGLSPEETLDYIKMMTLNYDEIKNKDIYLCLNINHVNIVKEYILDPHTATTFMELKKQSTGRKKEIVTSELIYYWMLEAGVPFECDKWNLNHLLTLLRVVSVKNSNAKMSKKDTKDFNKAMMAKRRAGLKK